MFLRNLVLLVGVCAFFSVRAGDISVHPLSVSLDERERSQAITVFNTSNEQATIRIELVEREMQANGHLSTPAEAPPWSAAGMLRFSPRQVNIPPRGKQVVRILYRRKADLPDGEYRSHLKLSRLPTGSPPAAGSNTREGLSPRLNVISGISLPIFVRNGAVHSAVELKSVQRVLGADGQSTQWEVRLSRRGNGSARPALSLVDSPRAADRQPGHMLGTVPIYAELGERFFRFDLPPRYTAKKPIFIKMVNPADGSVDFLSLSQ